MDVQVRLNGYKIFSVWASVFAGGWKRGLGLCPVERRGLYLSIKFYVVKMRVLSEIL